MIPGRRPLSPPARGIAGSADSSNLFITCPRGLEPILSDEIRALGRPVNGVADAGVWSSGGWDVVREFNLWLRTAHRVLWSAGRGVASSTDDLYAAALRVPWESQLGPDTPFQVRASLELPGMADERFCALRVKDAVADRLRNRFGRRPDSRAAPESVPLFARWSANGRVDFFFDTSGVPLSFRGYRTESGPAPLRESLAAGLVLWSEWDRSSTLIHPMCGRGALAIEAAWIAINRAPGLRRAFFSFERFCGHEADAWGALRAQAEQREKSDGKQPLILATDSDPAAVEAARRNAHRAGVAALVRHETCAFDATRIPEGSRWILINPPYGLRMGGAPEEVQVLYGQLGAWLRTVGGPGRAVVISGNLRASRRMGLTSSRRTTMFNGPVECRVIEFPLYPPGSKPAPAKDSRAGPG
ncbi:MAG: class I SAM-dependent RNA methyltransferase [Kiritimatiellae bacterium]|nr:class I SAM-dependent RNA methyltransferase [Kiritimatiellia bacterium]